MQKRACRWIGGMTAVALGCCACQAAPPASAYNEKLSAAQTTEAPKEEAWEGYVPYDNREPFRATLSNGAYQLSIDADVVATRAPQYYTLRVEIAPWEESSRQELVTGFFGDTPYEAKEIPREPGVTNYEYNALVPGANGLYPRVVFSGYNNGPVVLWSKKGEQKDFGPNITSWPLWTVSEIEGVFGPEWESLSRQAYEKLVQWGIADRYGVSDRELLAYYYDDLEGGVPAAFFFFPRTYEGVPVYPVNNGYLLLGDHIAYKDLMEGTGSFQGEGIQVVYGKGDFWGFQIQLTRELSREPVTLLSFSEVMAALQEQLLVHPPLALKDGRYQPTTITRVALAYCGIPISDDKGFSTQLEYRPHWVFSNGVDGNDGYAYTIYIDAVTGEARRIE